MVCFILFLNLTQPLKTASYTGQHGLDLMDLPPSDKKSKVVQTALNRGAPDRGFRYPVG